MGTKGERTAQRILDVSEELFAERGFEGTTLRDIALEVPLQPPSLYNHFETKEEIYDAVLDRAYEPLLDRLRHVAADGVALPPAELLPSAMLELLSHHPRVPKLLYRELLSDNPSTRSARKWLKQLVEVTFSLPGAGEELDEFALFVMGFNLVVGFFALERGLAAEIGIEVDQAEVLDRYRRLLSKVGPMLRVPRGKGRRKDGKAEASS